MRFSGKNQAFISIHHEDVVSGSSIDPLQADDFLLIWFKADNNRLTIDSKPYEFGHDQIVCLTEFHQIGEVQIGSARIIRFNRPFYCILDNDDEVSCKGLLFFGASNVPVISIPADDLQIFETVYEMFRIELKTNDKLQMEMLQMMLKRFLILCARAFKKQEHLNQLEEHQQDIVREYNYLVEKHFRDKQSVKDYAEMLYKSPKTLSNLFAKMGQKTPLEFIHNRIILEARRLLTHSNKSIKEIAYEIGFEDQQTFSRFFKKKEGMSPIAYRGSN